MKNSVKIALAIGVGVLIGLYLKKSSQAVAAPLPSDETIKKGDLSKDVEKLQSLINRLFGSEVVEVTGAYDKKTSEVVKIIFANTPELVNLEQGELTVKSVTLLNQILDNIQPKKDNNE